MKGLEVRSSLDFVPLFKPITPYFAALYWYFDTQTSPFSLSWQLDNEENERRVDDLRVDVPHIRTRSGRVWRPGILPTMAPHLFFDEWSYLVGFEAGNASIEHMIEALDRTARPLDREYFQVVHEYARIALVHVAGDWWEVYPADVEWIYTLEDHWSRRQIAFKRVDSSHWKTFH